MSITIHSKNNCKYCTLSKEFFNNNNMKFTEVFYDTESADYEEKKADLSKLVLDFKTFPQIFIGDELLGGYSDLLEASENLKLQDMCKKIGVEFECEF
jgi:glutaredoxin